MSDDPVIVVATITPQPGQQDAVEAALRDAIRVVHDEEGCLRYALHRTLDEPTRFVMIEKWTTAAALDAHRRGAALAELGGRLEGLVAGPADVVRLAALPDGETELGRL
ncbi:MAG: antibiotic biosynthesis monooxygenase [Pseudonocardiaceae bacterium]|nr:antibiotic biosynthesis monooxygenase [Pseudonocardiaceae bacterium]